MFAGRFCWIVACGLLMGGNSLAAELVALSSGAWKWQKGRSEASNPVDAWRQLGFADGTWATATAPFHYGESIQTGTLINDMQNQYSSIFLRRSFNVSDAAAVATLTLHAICDDGFVAWINGRIVASNNIPATLTFNAFAPAAVAEPVQLTGYNVPNPGGVLRPGENVLAVQVFNASLSSSDLLFDAQLLTTERETIPPTLVAINPFPGSVTNLTQVTVTFSEPVQGVTASALRINDIPATAVTGSGATYTFTFAQPNYGTVQFSWSLDAVITDLAVPPNRFDRTGPNATFIFDLIDPTSPFVATTHPPRGATVRALREIVLMFNKVVNGVDAADLRVNGQAAVAFSGLGAGPYVFTLPDLAKGPVSVTWVADPGIADENGKPFEPAAWSYDLSPSQVMPRIRINELHAANVNGLKDEDTSAEDWIELYNEENFPVNLEGWSLTDRLSDPGRWVFPPVTIPARSYLVLFASSKDRSGPGWMHTNFKLGADGEYLGLFNLDSPRAEVSALTFPEQRNDISFGIDPTEQWRYFRTPSPGSPNPASNIGGVVEPVYFSVKRGYFSSPFQLTLHSPTPGTVVRYTMDGSEPTATVGTNYTGPIRIDRTRTIRAAAFEPTRLPSRTETHTYLYNIPGTRTRLPVLSLVTASNHLYGTTGIMEVSPRNTTKRGPAWERPVSVELIRPEDNGGFQIDCGIRLQGGDYIRGLYNYRSAELPASKYSYRLYFRGDYGAGKLNYPLIPGLPFSSFDEIALRAGMNDHSNPFLRDEMVRALSSDVGIVASHGTFVHLYLNGVYKGIYNPTERIGEEFLQQWHGGGDKWDIIAQMNELVEGDMVVWNRLRNLLNNQNSTNPVVYQQVQSMLDVENFIDYLLPNIYANTDDWPHNNWRAARERTADGKFRFYVWDAEFSFGYTGSPAHNTIANQLSTLSPPWGTTEIQRIFTRIRLSPEFKLHFADRVHKHFFNGGALTDEKVRERYNHMKAGLAPSISGFNDTIGTAWIPNRRRNVTNHLNSAGFLLSSNAPVFSQFGGRVARGYELTMTAGLGEIYYTTNGVDPRVPFTGEVHPQAVLYTKPVAIGDSTLFKARTFWSATNWSAVTETSFRVEQIGVPLRITEIMYNPVGGDAFEYVEIQNIGAVPLSLANFSFDGITYRFGTDEPPLAPGARLVLSSGVDPGAFQQRYPGVVVRGRYSGNLSNGGERLAIRDPSGNIITAVEYDDENGWPLGADGQGYSLELVDVNGDAGAASNWAASARPGGTPGEANAPLVHGAVRLNEVFATGQTGSVPAADFVELVNTGEVEVDLSGWSLTDSSDPRRYVFPAGTRIAGRGYLVLWCDNARTPGLHTGFGLAQRGEHLTLFDAQVKRMDALSFGLQLPGYSVGKSEVTSEWTLTVPTPGARNQTVPLSTNLVINEFLANATPGNEDWVELHNADGNAPAGIGGYYLVLSNAVSRLPALSFVPPSGHVQIWADELYGPDHLWFKLPAGGGTIALADAVGLEINRVTYGPQKEGISFGRLPDGAGFLREFPSSASPGAANYLPAPTNLRLSEVLAAPLSPQAGTGRVAGWIEIANTSGTAVPLAGYSLGLNRARPRDWVFPDLTVPANGWLVVWCDPLQQNSANTGIELNPFGGSVYLFDPADRVVDFVVYGAQMPDRSLSAAGTGWYLSAASTPGQANSGPAGLGSTGEVRINEWMAAPLMGEDWVELFNPQDRPVDLGGMVLTDNPSVQARTNSPIAALTIVPPGGFVLLEASPGLERGTEHLAFGLNAFGETMRLYSGFLVVDEITMLPQMPGVSEGRSPDGAGTIVAFPGRATPRASNATMTLDSDNDGLPDEWELAHGLNPNDPADAAGDLDGDGMSNLAEYLAGTDPRDPHSALRMLVERFGGDISIRFEAAENRSYRVLSTDNLSSPGWQPVLNVEAGAKRSIQYTDRPSTGGSRFYRVVTTPQP